MSSATEFQQALTLAVASVFDGRCRGARLVDATTVEIVEATSERCERRSIDIDEGLRALVFPPGAATFTALTAGFIREVDLEGDVISELVDPDAVDLHVSRSDRSASSVLVERANGDLAVAAESHGRLADDQQLIDFSWCGRRLTKSATSYLVDDVPLKLDTAEVLDASLHGILQRLGTNALQVQTLERSAVPVALAKLPGHILDATIWAGESEVGAVATVVRPELGSVELWTTNSREAELRSSSGDMTLGRSTAAGVGFTTVGISAGIALNWLCPDGSVLACASLVESAPADHVLSSAGMLKSGATYFGWRVRGSGATVVCLHGGPDAYEFDELRYCGLYERILARGIDVIVLNYSGSRFLRVRAARPWSQSISADLEQLVELELGDSSPMVLLGGSFGATLALAVAATDLPIAGVVVHSAVVDMPAHIDKARRLDVASHRKLEQLFPDGAVDLTPDRLGGRCATTLLHCPADEIASYEAVVDFAEQIGARLVEYDGGHSPKADAAPPFADLLLYELMLLLDAIDS